MASFSKFSIISYSKNLLPVKYIDIPFLEHIQLPASLRDANVTGPLRFAKGSTSGPQRLGASARPDGRKAWARKERPYSLRAKPSGGRAAGVPNGRKNASPRLVCRRDLPTCEFVNDFSIKKGPLLGLRGLPKRYISEEFGVADFSLQLKFLNWIFRFFWIPILIYKDLSNKLYIFKK